MSTVLEQMKALAAQAAATGPDMTEVQTGGDRRVLPLGVAQARLVEYVELGMQPQEFGGKAKEPAMEFQLGFALTGFAPNPEDPSAPLPYANADGSPYIFRTYSMGLSRNEKARAFLTFKAMNYKSLHKHFAQMLGEAFLLPIVDKVNEKTKKTTRTADTLGIRPPHYPDPATGQTISLNVAPPRDEDLRIFIWDHPTLEGWKALEIEGEWENKDAATGAVTKKSKNFIQEKMLSATDFAGSQLAILLGTNNVAYKIPPKPAAVAAPATPGAALPPTQPATPVVAATPQVIAAVPVVVATPAPVLPTEAASPVLPVTTPSAEVQQPVVVPIQQPAPVEPSSAGVVVPASPAVVLPVLPVAA